MNNTIVNKTLQDILHKYPDEYIICVDRAFGWDTLPELVNPRLYINTDIGQIEIGVENDKMIDDDLIAEYNKRKDQKFKAFEWHESHEPLPDFECMILATLWYDTFRYAVCWYDGKELIDSSDPNIKYDIEGFEKWMIIKEP